MLGSGNFSCAYLGQLPDNTKIAVKKLDDDTHDKYVFLAAMKIIRSISHVNLVLLWGFCDEGSHMILVYKLLKDEDRSLDWYLFLLQNSSPLINVETCHSIALGTARGLVHLHKNCNLSGILHGAVKPENIIIDRNMNPKLVNFDLVGLMSRSQRLSEAQMRGSHGYMALEWIKSQPITKKVDIYSLGIVILELVSGRRCLKQGVSQETYFLHTWGFSLLNCREDFPDRVLELIDPLLEVRILPTTDQQLFKAMIYVVLLCLQEDPSLWPSMKKVVRMLEGNIFLDNLPSCTSLDAFAREMFEKGYVGERVPKNSNSIITYQQPQE